MFKATIITALVGSAFAMEYAQHSYNFPDDETDRVEQCGNVVTQMRKRHDPKFRAEDVKETQQGVLGQATVSPTVSELANEIAEECKEHAQTHDALAEEVCNYADYKEEGIFTNISFDRNHEEFKKSARKYGALCSTILDRFAGKFSEKYTGDNPDEKFWVKESESNIWFTFVDFDHVTVSKCGQLLEPNQTPLRLSGLAFEFEGQYIEVVGGLCKRYDFEQARDTTEECGRATLNGRANFEVRVEGRQFTFNALAQMAFGWN